MISQQSNWETDGNTEQQINSIENKAKRSANIQKDAMKNAWWCPFPITNVRSIEYFRNFATGLIYGFILPGFGMTRITVIIEFLSTGHSKDFCWNAMDLINKLNSLLFYNWILYAHRKSKTFFFFWIWHIMKHIMEWHYFVVSKGKLCRSYVFFCLKTF